MIRRPPRSTLFPYTTLFRSGFHPHERRVAPAVAVKDLLAGEGDLYGPAGERSEEHTSELQSQSNLVCRLLLEKKKIKSTKGRWSTNGVHWTAHPSAIQRSLA